MPRTTAARAADRLGHLVRDRRLVILDPDRPQDAHVSPGYAPAEVHTPLHYAPTPASLARHWFSDAQIERHLDALQRAQGDDGGWYFNWRDWNPAATIEWRAWITVDTLLELRAYGRLA